MLSSLGFSVIACGLAVKAGHVLCLTLGGAVPFYRFLYIFCVSQVSRYLPGRIWPVVGFTVLLEREKIRRSVAFALPFLHQGTMVTVFLLLGVLLCGPVVTTKLVHQPIAIVYTVCGVLALILVLLPPVSRLFNRSVPITVTRAGYYKCILLFVMSGVILSWAFFFFLASLVSVSLSQALFLGGFFLLAYVMGWIVFLAPAGLGVREGTLGLLLSSVWPLGLSNLIALAARLWMTVAELMLLGGVFLVVKLVKGKYLLSADQESRTYT